MSICCLQVGLIGSQGLKTIRYLTRGSFRRPTQCSSHNRRTTETYRNTLHATANDQEFEVVARNVVILLYILTSLEDGEPRDTDRNTDTVESVIHLWYSAFLPEDLADGCRRLVKPLFAEVCSDIRDKPASTMLGKTWEFGSQNNLRLVLSKELWIRLENYFDAVRLSQEAANRIRTAVTLAPERKDFRDRWFFKDATRFARVAKQRFREDGLLLPFGHPRDRFTVPNP